LIVIMLIGIISMINLKLVGVAMDVNDLLHEAMMEMAQNDTHVTSDVTKQSPISSLLCVTCKGF